MNAISYHTFIFPFLWDPNEKKSKSITDCLRDGWVREKLTDVKECPWTFAQYRYFNATAQEAIYDQGNSEYIVRNYRFDFESLIDRKPDIRRELNRVKDHMSVARFLLKKETTEYSLVLNGLRLKCYRSGVGLLIFELENYDYSSMADINRINDWGRRLYAPYRTDENKCDQCADAITLKYNETEISVDTLIPCKDDAVSVMLPEFVTKVLFGEQIEAFAKDVKLIVGDRMHVACLCQNEDLWRSSVAWQNGEYAYLRDATEKAPGDSDNVASELYKFMFVDGNGLTCFDRHMIHDLLQRNVYGRWSESGTLYGITEYSLMCLIGSWHPAPVTSFPTEYIEMVCLVLAQRAHILMFEKRISECAVDEKTARKTIDEVQDEYIKFQSQLLLEEVSPEQQGIELYTELLKNMFICEQTKQIEIQIKAQFDLKNYKNDQVESKVLFAITVLGLIEVVDCIADWLFELWNIECSAFICSVVSVIGIVLLLYLRKKWSV